MKIAILVLAAAAAHAQPAFEVASVKLSRGGPDADGMTRSDVTIVGPGRLRAYNASLRECLEWAYEARSDQISGPVDGTNYEIEATAPPDTAPADMRRMLQTLLNERFQLKLRRETKEVAAYDLVVAKGGPKLPPPKPEGQAGMILSAGGRLTGALVRTRNLANSLRRETGRPVFDKTGLDQPFSFELNFATDRDRDSGRPSIFTALEGTLGLKLTATRAPVDYLIVEHAVRIPTGN